MKRSCAILLLIIFLFNLVGYNLLFNYFINRSDAQFEAMLDEERYREEELTELKVALHLPYPSYQAEFERTSGEIQINNVHYSYVKKRIANDTMYLLCKPNAAKTSLVKDKSRYVNSANDLPGTKKHNESGPKKAGFGFEYHNYSSYTLPECPDLVQGLLFPLLHQSLSAGFPSHLQHPPCLLS